MYKFDTLAVTKGQSSSVHTITLGVGRSLLTFEFRSDNPNVKASAPVSEAKTGEFETDKRIKHPPKEGEPDTSRQKMFNALVISLISQHRDHALPIIFMDRENNKWKLDRDAAAWAKEYGPFEAIDGEDGLECLICRLS